jgi:hypothetical protein
MSAAQNFDESIDRGDGLQFNDAIRWGEFVNWRAPADRDMISAKRSPAFWGSRALRVFRRTE